MSIYHCSTQLRPFINEVAEVLNLRPIRGQRKLLGRHLSSEDSKAHLYNIGAVALDPETAETTRGVCVRRGRSGEGGGAMVIRMIIEMTPLSTMRIKPLSDY